MIFIVRLKSENNQDFAPSEFSFFQILCSLKDKHRRKQIISVKILSSPQKKRRYFWSKYRYIKNYWRYFISSCKRECKGTDTFKISLMNNVNKVHNYNVSKDDKVAAIWFHQQIIPYWLSTNITNICNYLSYLMIISS